jgi:outer membrane protein assembly factor BamB
MQDWMNWRGPSYNGSTEAKSLPVKFSPTEGVKWAAPMPGPTAATPIVQGDSVYITSADIDKQLLIAYCLDRKTGKVKWQDAMGSGYQPGGQGNKVRLDERSHYAAPSPVTDGKRVVFFFGNGDLAAFLPSGKKLWQRNLQRDYGDFAFQWTFSSSPQLWRDKLYVQILQRNQPVGARGKGTPESFLLALNPSTGAELWRSARPSEASNESRESYGTPIPHTVNGKTQLLISGGDVLTGHDPETGKELWRWGTWNEGHREQWWRLVPSPVAGDGVVLVCAPKRAPVYATRLETAAPAWRSEERGNVTSDVPTPCFAQGRFYVLSDVKKSLSCVEAKTGAVVWSVPTPGRQMCWGSPTLADGKLYVIDLNGVVFVFEAATGKLLAENPMDTEGSDIRSSIAVAYNNLFIRTKDKLYCVGR